MRRIDVPFNIYLLELTAAKLAMMKPVTVTDSMDGATTDFHPQGLFSTEIFHKVGDRRREGVFSYIDIKIPIFHPLVYHAMVKMKRFYADIFACKKYAIWNDEKKDFEPATPSNGETGMHFFIKHWEKINFIETGSTQREQFIELITKYKHLALTDKIVVIPAGLRDMEIGDDGRKVEDEINAIYRKFIAISNSITTAAINNNPEILDRSRFDMQRNFNLLYSTLENMIQGKKKMFQGSMLSRRIQNGTRNVITAGNPSVRYLGSEGNPTYNSTIVGLYQFSQAIGPVTIYKVRKLLDNIFLDVNEPSYLVDQKTLRNKSVQLPSKIYDKWGTNEGLRKTLAEYREEQVRDIPIIVGGHYLALIYIGPDKTFRLFNSIDELPADRSKEHVRPVTLTDLLFIALYQDANTYPGFVTRYPVSGVGSIYPSFAHLRVTAKYEKRHRLDANWQDMGESWIAYEFPIQGSGFINSLIPHPSHLGRLNADFDGDTSSFNVVYSKEAIEEITAFMKTRRAYVGTDGNFLYDIGTDTVNIVLANCTGDPVIEKKVEYREEDDSTFTHHGTYYSINKVLEQLILDRTQPILLKWLEGQIPDPETLQVDRFNKADSSIPVLVAQDGDKTWLVDGNHRAAKAKQEGKKWVRAYILSKEMLAKAKV